MAWPKGRPRKPHVNGAVVPSAPPLEWGAEKDGWGRVQVELSRAGKVLARWQPNPRYFWREVLEAQMLHTKGES